LLGLDPARTPPTSFSIGIDAPEVIRAKMAEADPFRILKVKVGTPNDIETLSIVRECAPDKRIRVDANGGWSPEEAADRIAELAPFDIELVEQPIAAGRLGALAGLTRLSGTTVIADEDCVVPADVPRLAGVVHGVNVKLSKCGGIRRALAMIHAARACGLKVMLGCMIETSLGISAAAQIASSVDYVDLDAHLLLEADHYRGLKLSDGVVRPRRHPGLGVVEARPA